MIDEKDHVISRRECAVKTMTEELIKANDIIRKLQGDIRSLNIKVIFINYFQAIPGKCRFNSVLSV